MIASGRAAASMICEHALLEVLALGQALLHEVGVGDGGLDRGGDGQRALGRATPGNSAARARARRGDHGLELAADLRVGIEDRDVVAVEKKARRPAGADDAAADKADRSVCSSLSLACAVSAFRALRRGRARARPWW